MLEPESQVRGVVVIMNVEGMSMAQGKARSPARASIPYSKIIFVCNKYSFS